MPCCDKRNPPDIQQVILKTAVLLAQQLIHVHNGLHPVVVDTIHHNNQTLLYFFLLPYRFMRTTEVHPMPKFMISTTYAALPRDLSGTTKVFKCSACSRGCVSNIGLTCNLGFPSGSLAISCNMLNWIRGWVWILLSPADSILEKGEWSLHWFTRPGRPETMDMTLNKKVTELWWARCGFRTNVAHCSFKILSSVALSHS